MRLAYVGMVVGLTLSSGCLRFGYNPVGAAQDSKTDAAPGGGASDAASGGAGTRADATVPLDASDRDAQVRDGGAADAGADAGAKDAGRPPSDAGTDAATDAGSGGGGSSDAAVEDAAIEDAAVEDAAVEDASIDSGSSDPCLGRTDLLFCDGFEDSSFDTWDYPVVMNGELEQSTDPVRSGSGALRATTTQVSNANSAARYGKRVFDHVKSGDVWARAYYYLPSTTTIDTFFSTLLITEVEPPYFGCSVLVRPTRLELGGVTTRFYTLSPFPRDTWTCVELHIKIDGSAGICEAYVDGMIALQSPAVDTLPAMGYTSLDVGIHYTEPSQSSVELFVDDVAAGTTRVGCD